MLVSTAFLPERIGSIRKYLFLERNFKIARPKIEFSCFVLKILRLEV